MCLGIPGKVVSIADASRNLANVDVSGVQREVDLSCVIDDDHALEQCIDDWVLVHVGFAMSRIDEEEAANTLKVLEDLGEVQEELAAMESSGRPLADPALPG